MYLYEGNVVVDCFKTEDKKPLSFYSVYSSDGKSVSKGLAYKAVASLKKRNISYVHDKFGFRKGYVVRGDKRNELWFSKPSGVSADKIQQRDVLYPLGKGF